MRRALALICLSLATAEARPIASLSLRSSYGGAVLEGRMTSNKADTLVRVTSSMGKGRLLKCSPRCSIISTIPISGSLALGSQTSYRIALGGHFRVGQKVNLYLHFKKQGVISVQATVIR